MMALRVVPSVLGKRRFTDLYVGSVCLAPSIVAHHYINRPLQRRLYATVDEQRPACSTPPQESERSGHSHKDNDHVQEKPAKNDFAKQTAADSKSQSDSSTLDPLDWEANPDLSISSFKDLPSKTFGVNQHIIINEDFKEALRQILWQFRAPIRYAFAYGSGVFSQSTKSSKAMQSVHPSPPEAITKVQSSGPKMIDFIFGVSFSQHWHSLNIQQHPDHYSGVKHLGSYAVSQIQDSIGAGCYFHPYITVNGVLIKYGVVNLDTLCRDLSEWDTLYLAGRLQKPVKILRDHPSVRLANQVNLISAIRTALLLLPDDFTEQDLYATIAGISYMGDPRMSLPTEDPKKVLNIVSAQLPNFRRLYAPLIELFPNLRFNDPACNKRDWVDDPSINSKMQQDMDPVRRGNMVRRLPSRFREKLYFEYQSKFGIPRGEFQEYLKKTADNEPDRIRKRQGGEFEQRIAKDTDGLKTEVRQVIEKTIRWPSLTQSAKGLVTGGIRRSWRYMSEKRAKHKNSQSSA